MAGRKSSPGESIIESIQQLVEATIITVSGDIDLSHSLAFQKETSDIVNLSPKRIVVVLTKVPYMDSSGIASLVKLLSLCRNKNITLALVGMADRVRGLFEIMRLDSMFKMFNTIEEALKSTA